MLSKSKAQTQKLAARLAKKILKANRLEKNRGAVVIALCGALGSGKTTFVQGFMEAMGVKHQITSPTFIIFRRYQSVYHFDLYRLDKPQDVLKLGFKKIIGDQQNIVLIEWPEIIKKFLPKNTIWVKFRHGKNKKERIIKISD